MVDEKEIEGELGIDKNDLDEECCGQPQLYYRWAKETAIASKRKHIMEGRLSRVRARADHKIRKQPGLYGLGDDPKEKAIAGHVALDQDVKDAEEVYLEAKKDAALTAAAEKSFEQRKQMIKTLGDLFVHEYYSAPTIKKAEVHAYRAEVRKRRRLAGR